LRVPDEGYSNLLILSVPDEGYSNLLILSVPDEGYSNLLILSVPDEGYSRNVCSHFHKNNLTKFFLNSSVMESNLLQHFFD
jgi:hypothetical protein